MQATLWHRANVLASLGARPLQQRIIHAVPPVRRNLILNAQALPPTPFDVRVRAAASAGYRGLSLRPLEYRAALAGGFDDAAQLALLEECGVEVSEVGLATTWHPGAGGRAGIDEDEAVLWHMARLYRPRQLNAALWHTHDAADGARAFAALCDRAADLGLLVALEFIPHSGIRNLAAGWRMVERADRPNGGLILDTWHMHRAGDRHADLEQVPADKCFTLQLCDAAVEPWPEVKEESRHGRLLPGEGVIDFVGLLDRLHAAGARPLVSVEVISDVLHRLPPDEVTRRTLAAATSVIERSRFEPGWWAPPHRARASRRDSAS